MKDSLRRSCLIVISLLASLAIAEPALAQSGIDRVQRRNGIDSGEIISVTPLGVTISKSGVTSQIPAEEIRSISFAGEPPQLNAVRRSLARGRFDSASKTLSELEESDITRPEVRQEYDFLQATSQGNLALAGKEDLQEALAMVSSFLATHRTSYHVPEIIELQGDLLLAAGDTAGAQKKYQTLAKAPSPYYKSRSAFLVGKLMLREGIPSGAIEQFDAVLDIASGHPAAEELQTTAKLQRAVSLAATGKGDEAVDTVTQWIASAPSDETELIAEGYNALGACYLASDNLRAARDALLHVDLLFPSSEHHAEALFHLAQVWERLNQPTRAKEARQRLEDEYPLSRWAGR